MIHRWKETSCIIHYERENNYNVQQTQITGKTSDTILRAKREHKKIRACLVSTMLHDSQQ